MRLEGYQIREELSQAEKKKKKKEGPLGALCNLKINNSEGKLNT